MSTEPGAAFRAMADEPTSALLQKQQQGRIVLAWLLLVGTVFVFIVDEARRWEPVVDVGMKVGRSLIAVEAVVDGSPAAAAGIERGDSIETIDGHRFDPYAHRDRLERPLSTDAFFTWNGWLMVPPATQLTVATKGDRIVTEHVVVANGPVVRARHWARPFVLVQGLLMVGVLAVLLAAIVEAATQPLPITQTAADELRRRSFVVPSVLMALLAPVWLHAIVATLLGPALTVGMYLPVIAATTFVPWIVFLVVTANAAARHADGDFDTAVVRWPLLLTAAIPGAMLGGLPTAAVLVLALVIFKRQRRWHRRLLVEEAPRLAR